MLAGEIFELAKKAKKGQGKKLAREIIDSGKAYAKFVEMLEAQKIKAVYPETIPIGEHVATMHAMHSGKITHVDNKETNKVAKIAGAPFDKGAGIQLYVHKGDTVVRGDKLFSIYAENKERLEFAIEEAHARTPIEITAQKVSTKKKASKSKPKTAKKKVVIKKAVPKKMIAKKVTKKKVVKKVASKKAKPKTTKKKVAKAKPKATKKIVKRKAPKKAKPKTVQKKVAKKITKKRR